MRSLALSLAFLTACGSSKSSSKPDGAVEHPDAAPGTPDASVTPRPDAAPGTPDAAPQQTADAAPPADAKVGAPGHWIMGYYPGYGSGDYTPEQIDYASMTHIAMGAIVPAYDNSKNAWYLDMTFYQGDQTQGETLASDVSTRAHAAGTKAILMVGGAGTQAGWEHFAASTNVDAFVTSLLAEMDKLGYDGLDLDWEPFDTSDEPLLSTLATKLRTARSSIILTMPIGWQNANFPSVSSFYKDNQATFDQLNIMSYEMADSDADGWSGWTSWYFAALKGEGGSTPSSVSSSVDAYVASGVAKAKLGIGVGFYGSCWQGVTGPNQDTTSATIPVSDNVMTYAHIMSAHYSAGAYTYDTTTEQPSLSFPGGHGPENCNWVTYEDSRSIAAKGAYVQSQGLGGGIIWAIEEGFDGSKNDPLTAMRAAFP